MSHVFDKKTVNLNGRKRLYEILMDLSIYKLSFLNFIAQSVYNIFLIFLMHIFLCPRDRRSGGILVLSCLSFCNSVLNFNLVNNFSTVSARALIFHMSIPCDKISPWVPLFFTLRPRPWMRTRSKTAILAQPKVAKMTDLPPLKSV